MDDCDNEICVSTQFLEIQKNQLIDLHESLERYWNVLPVFGFNSANYDLNLIKSYLLPIFNERNIEPTVIKKANQFISFKFGNSQLLDIINFLGGATSLDSFSKAYKTSETKGFFPYEWLDHADKMQNKELPPNDAFYSKLRSCNTLEAEYADYVSLSKSGLTIEQAVLKLKLSKPPPTGIQNYQYLQQLWKQEKKTSFKDFLHWCSNKECCANIRSNAKNDSFLPWQRYRYVKAWLYFTKPGQHLLTQIYWCTFTERDENFMEKIREEVVGAPPIVFTREAVVDEIFIRKCTNICKSIVGIDASQLYPY